MAGPRRPRRIRVTAPGTRATAFRSGPIAQGDFVGDKRKTFGGVAGFGARVAPGVNLGFSVDQSHTDIDVPLALQSATLDLTQIGFNGSVDKGPWTWAFAVVHGFGKVHSSRDTGFGLATAGYRAAVDGALTEISYYWTKDQMRVVPKGALEYVRATGAAFQEAGGLDPLNVGSSAISRARVMIGAEIGRYFIFDQKILDLSAYGKFVDNFYQNLGSVQVSLGHPEHRRPRHRREPLRHGRRRLGLAQPDQHRAALRQLRRQVPQRADVAPGHGRLRIRWCEHDPEKCSGFPSRQTRNAFARRSCSK